MGERVGEYIFRESYPDGDRIRFGEPKKRRTEGSWKPALGKRQHALYSALNAAAKRFYARPLLKACRRPVVPKDQPAVPEQHRFAQEMRKLGLVREFYLEDFAYLYRIAVWLVMSQKGRERLDRANIWDAERWEEVHPTRDPSEYDDSLESSHPNVLAMHRLATGDDAPQLNPEEVSGLFQKALSDFFPSHSCTLPAPLSGHCRQDSEFNFLGLIKDMMQFAAEIEVDLEADDASALKWNDIFRILDPNTGYVVWTYDDDCNIDSQDERTQRVLFRILNDYAPTAESEGLPPLPFDPPRQADNLPRGALDPALVFLTGRHKTRRPDAEKFTWRLLFPDPEYREE